MHLLKITADMDSITAVQAAGLADLLSGSKGLLHWTRKSRILPGLCLRYTLGFLLLVVCPCVQSECRFACHCGRSKWSVACGFKC